MTGSNIPVGVISPFLTFSFIIVLSGIFPSRNRSPFHGAD
jgi:microcystin-dependent protein